MPLPSFPRGINTQLSAPPTLRPQHPKKPRRAKPATPRALFFTVFAVAMLVVALYPFLSRALVAP